MNWTSAPPVENDHIASIFAMHMEIDSSEIDSFDCNGYISKTASVRSGGIQILLNNADGFG
jgi:hypothetical protein